MDEQFVRASATVVAKNLSYKELKDLQMDVILAFVSGKDVLLFFLPDLERACAMGAYLSYLTFSINHNTHL